MNDDRARDADELASRVASNIERLRHEAGMTISQVIDESGIGRSVFYSRMRNETSWTLEGLARVASVLAVDPSELVASATTKEAFNEALVDGSVLAHRIALLLAAADQRPEPDELVSRMIEAGIAISSDLWKTYTTSTERFWASRSVLSDLASFFGVAPAYLTAPADDPDADRIEAQLELQGALKASGGQALGMRAIGDVSPSALRAIAKSLRPGGDDSTQ